MKKDNLSSTELALMERAQKVLENNWIGASTKPTSKLYPHQWSWDSAFISIGYAHYDMERAKTELRTLLEAQWEDGMVPHIVFSPEVTGYFPSADYWGIHRRADAPRHKKTSGITQPCVHAIAAYKIYELSSNKEEAKDFLKEIFPKLKKFHQWLAANRDPEGTGLITIFHPWESGFDNSPRWDEALNRIEVDRRLLPDYKRQDKEHVKDPNERPSDDEYDRYIYLVEIMKKNNYDQKNIYKEIPFKIKDVVFSSIFYAANQHLKSMAEIIGEDSSQIEEWIKATKEYFSETFSPKDEDGLFYDYDLTVRQIIKKRTVSSIVPLYTDLLTKHQAEILLKWLLHSHFCGTGKCAYPVIPSTDVHMSYFQEITYWRGPIWINTNWMIYKGLLRYGFSKKAKELKESIINLINEQGFNEYFDPLSGEGHGAEDFSWTASLLIDLICEGGM